MGQTNSDNYEYENIESIPTNLSPPPIQQLIDKSKELTLHMIDQMDPTNFTTCKDCLKKNSRDFKKSEKIITDLGFYDPDTPPFSEKTYRFYKNSSVHNSTPSLADSNHDNPSNNPFDEEYLNVIHISSTLNSDRTISYWVQFPLNAHCIKLAMLKIMNIPINVQNLLSITEKYAALYHRAKMETQNVIVKCEQIDPLYLKLVVDSLISRGYQSIFMNVAS